MKIGEMLLLRSETKKRVEALRARISKSAKVQEGTKAHDDVEALLKQAIQVNHEHQRLALALNEANLRARLKEGLTMTAALAKRDELAAEHSLLRAAVDSAVAEVDRYSSREIRWVATFDVASAQKQMDRIAIDLRNLNIEIQQINWEYEVEFTPTATA